MKKKKQTKRFTSSSSYYQEGGEKQDWISAKISKLIREENYDPSQAAAIAYSMYDKEFMQVGGQKQRIGVEQLQNLNLTSNTQVPTGNTMSFEEEQKSRAPQKPVSRILYNVETNEPKQGLPAGHYTRVDYGSGESDYLTTEGLENFKRMSNYRVFQEQQAKKQNAMGIASMEEGGELPMFQKAGQWNVGTMPAWNPQETKVGAPRVTSVGQLPAWDTTEKAKPFQVGVLPEWNPQGTPTATPVTAPTTNTTAATSRPQLTAELGSPITDLAPATLNTLNIQEDIKPAVAELNAKGDAYLNGDNSPQFSTTQDPFQFSNPYGDVDIATGAQVLGRGIQSGEASDIVAGGLKTGLGVARNIFGGMGQANIQEQAKKKYFDEQRDLVTGRNTPQYMQEGGEAMPPQEQMPPQEAAPQQAQPSPEEMMQMVAQALQQGAQPEEVMQQLVQAGIPQDQAMQLIQGVMQQMQAQAPQGQQAPPPQTPPQMQNGGSYLDTLKGKKIKDYTYNKDTDSYTVTYE